MDSGETCWQMHLHHCQAAAVLQWLQLFKKVVDPDFCGHQSSNFQQVYGVQLCYFYNKDILDVTVVSCNFIE